MPQLLTPRVPPSTGRSRGASLALAAWVLLALPGGAGAGPYRDTGHGSRVRGPSRDAKLPRGSCAQCHVEHGSGRGKNKRLWRENDNELCLTCHRAEDVDRGYPGWEIYERSAHSIDGRVIWPGPFPPPRRDAGAAGKCLNCHDPHGKSDRLGLVPSLLEVREGDLCLACHDGSPSSMDVSREVRKPYAHSPFRNAERHDAGEAGDPARHSYVAGNRHALCGDCHNAHAVARDAPAPVAPVASSRLARVGRVRVLNGPPGIVPQYEYRPANDTSAPVLEYEVCFKCHSSWTRQPPGEPDLALLLNPNNPSFHPVEAPGRNPTIDPRAFAGGRSAASVVYCSDCHGSDDAGTRGPHGSRFPNLLRARYEARSDSRMATPDELCFLCHGFEVYASGPAVLQGASRWNPPAAPNGHAFHVGERSVPCSACHDSHGSTRFPALIAVGRMPGLQAFGTTATGGSCAASCHGQRAYVVNYPR